MRKPGGYAVLISEDGMVERDTFTCKHCQRIVHVKPMGRPEDVGGLCKQCMGLVCPRCVAKASCTPWEKQMEIIEDRDRFRREVLQVTDG
ncbi:MAG: hypothetical protein ACREIB_06515 [Pseudomonadota bacterium]